MMIRVLVADDQSMVRAGFRALLGDEEDMEVVAEASNGLEAVEKAAQFDPSVVLTAASVVLVPPAPSVPSVAAPSPVSKAPMSGAASL